MFRLVFSYHVVSRLAYGIGVGIALVRQDRYQSFTRRYGVDAGFKKFRRIAAVLMTNDAASFVVLCLLTRQTVHLPVPTPILVGLGLLLCVVGGFTKLWATARLGWEPFFWHNFFVPGNPVMPDPPGPYRFLKNPMYTVGYLHMYGLALALGSLPGLLAAAFDQLAILAFYYWVEKPHYDLLMEGASQG